MHAFGLIFWLLIIIGIIGIAWFFGSLPKARDRTPHSAARELLEARYARGDINREENLQKKSDLEEVESVGRTSSVASNDLRPKPDV